MHNHIAMYQSGEIELDISIQNEGCREVTLYTSNISKQLKLDLKKQYSKNAYCKF